MKASQESLPQPEVKRRGRKPKNVSQESTVLEDLELSKSISKGNKLVDDRKEPKSAVQNIRWEDVRSQGSAKGEEEIEDSDLSSSIEFSENKKDRWRAENDIPSTSYEWLGLRTVEPAARPPILKLNKSNAARVAWAGRECTLTSSALRRARPSRPLEASFFDRLEAIRRVALSEVAKAGNSMEAVAILGIVIDREMLLLGAEEVYGQARAKTLVLETAPGNYEELAGSISADKKPRRFIKKREGTVRYEGQKVPREQSKGSLPYFSYPFRTGGTGVLYYPRCPRAQSMPSARAVSRRRSNWFYESSVAHMEGIWGSSPIMPVVTQWRTLEVEGCSSFKAERGREHEGQRGGKERNGTAFNRWGFCSPREGRGDIHLPSLYNSEERGGHSFDTRFEEGELPSPSPALFASWLQGGGSGGKEQPMAMRSRSSERISTNFDEQRCKKVSGGKCRGQDCGISGAPFWVIIKPLYFYSLHKLVGWSNSPEDRIGNGRLHRRLSYWWEDEGRSGGRTEGYKKFIQGVRSNSINKETSDSSKRSRIFGIPLVGGKKFCRANRREKAKVSKSCSEFIKRRPSYLEMEDGNWEVSLFEGSRRTNLATCEESTKTHQRQEEWNKDKCRGRGKGRLNLVERCPQEKKRVGFTSQGDIGLHCFRRFGCFGSIYFGAGWDKDSEEFCSAGPKQTHKFQGARGFTKVLAGTRRLAKEQKSCLVLRQCHSQSSCDETRLSTGQSNPLAGNKGCARDYGEEEYQDNSKTCPGNFKSSGRCSVKTRRSGWRMVGSPQANYGQMGTTRSRSRGNNARLYGANRGFIMEWEQDYFKTTDKIYSRDVGMVGEGGRQESKKLPSITLEGLCGINNPHVEESIVVEQSKCTESGLDRSWEAGGREVSDLVVQKQTRAIVDCILNSHKDALWSERTWTKYRGTIEHFTRWYLKQDPGGRKKDGIKNKVKFMSKNIVPYLKSLLGNVSGENLNSRGRSLMRMFVSYLTAKNKSEIELVLRQLRRSANIVHPPIHRAADALRLQDLRELLKRAEFSKITKMEHQALDILVIAFASISRVAEIISLSVRDVSPDGKYISVRVKTQAATCKRHIKYLSNGESLYPVDLLRKQREEAILYGRKLLYSARPDTDIPLTSSDITQTLKRITNKLQLKCRITAHSSRKGAAVAALLAGVPLVIIQSLGVWKCIDSLQAYVGKTIREEFCVLDFLGKNNW